MLRPRRWSWLLQCPNGRPARRARLHVEQLEELTLLSAGALFDSVRGELLIRGDAGDNAARQALGPTGFLELTLDGRRSSSDPASAFFDRALAGASAATMTAVRFDGVGGRDTLALGEQKLPGRFAARAPSLTVDGALGAAAVALRADEGLSVETTGRIAAGRIDLSADRFANAGQLRTDGGAVAVRARSVLHAGRISADGGLVRVTFTESYVETAAALTSALGGWLAIDGGTTGRLFSSLSPENNSLGGSYGFGETGFAGWSSTSKMFTCGSDGLLFDKEDWEFGICPTRLPLSLPAQAPDAWMVNAAE